jgi:protein-L-isoaspartate(D-aspartate) O-methyltransferase
VSDHNFESMRAAMIASQLRTNSVSDPKVVAALEGVAREDFVPADRVSLAYVDVPIPLGNGRALNAPLVSGRLIVEAAIQQTDKILLIGAATGYVAMVLASLGGDLVAVECDAGLADQARAALSDTAGVTIVEGPLEIGCADHAPYDCIIVDGAIESVPSIFWEQLKPGGALLAGIVEDGVTRLAKGRQTAGRGVMIAFADVEIVKLPGFSAPKDFVF